MECRTHSIECNASQPSSLTIRVWMDLTAFGIEPEWMDVDPSKTPKIRDLITHLSTTKGIQPNIMLTATLPYGVFLLWKSEPVGQFMRNGDHIVVKVEIPPCQIRVWMDLTAFGIEPEWMDVDPTKTPKIQDLINHLSATKGIQTNLILNAALPNGTLPYWNNCSVDNMRHGDHIVVTVETPPRRDHFAAFRHG